MDPATLALIFRVAQAAIQALPGAINAFTALKDSFENDQKISDAALQKAQAVVDDLNTQIQKM